MWSTRLIEQPILDSDKVFYIILQLGYQELPTASDRQGTRPLLNYAKRVCRQIGVQLWSIEIAHDHSRPFVHYAFHFPRYARNDVRAQTVGESLLAAVSILCGSMIDDSVAPVLRVPRHFVLEAPRVRSDNLLALEYQREWSERVIGSSGTELGSVAYTYSKCIRSAWRALPALVRSRQAHLAAVFLCASYRDVDIRFADLPLEEMELMLKPADAFGQSRKENALLNSYKAIEAIVGQPPSSMEKLAGRLQSVGVDAYTPIGYGQRRPLVQAIYDIEKLRNKKSAHGSTKDRSLALADVVACQWVAESVLLGFVDFLLEHSYKDESNHE